jgi:diacylglycerol kinase (ATP)
MKHDNLKILFIINPFSGNNNTNWTEEIENFLASTNHNFEIYCLDKSCNIITLKERIKLFNPNWIVAVGGDGTIKLVAECLLHTNLLMGIIPAGSANGLAKELGIPENPTEALHILLKGFTKKIHLTQINKQLCIHLSDIGLNAYAMKKFKSQGLRGKFGYLLAALKVLWQNPIMDIVMQIDEKTIKINAVMIIIANATKYGTGLLINPIGKLDDELFEVIVIKKVDFFEIFKMNFYQNGYDAENTEIFQTNALTMKSHRKVHFQIDGEYFGKVTEINANIIKNAIEIIVPNV